MNFLNHLNIYDIQIKTFPVVPNLICSVDFITEICLSRKLTCSLNNIDNINYSYDCVTMTLIYLSLFMSLMSLLKKLEKILSKSYLFDEINYFI